MIKANELRIGNLVFDDQNVIAKIESIQSKEYSKWNGDDIDVIFSIDGNMKESTISPIPLSEDWLLKFGFECIANGGDQKRFGLKNRNKNCFYGVELDHEEICLNKQSLFGCETLIHNEIFLQYVHQLQNIYFALTGEDLVFSTDP